MKVGGMRVEEGRICEISYEIVAESRSSLVLLRELTINGDERMDASDARGQ